jgi:hypothetical protein
MKKVVPRVAAPVLTVTLFLLTAWAYSLEGLADTWLALLVQFIKLSVTASVGVFWWRKRRARAALTTYLVLDSLIILVSLLVVRGVELPAWLARVSIF